MAFSPSEPIPRPAIDAVTMTREGSSRVAFFSSNGANLCGFAISKCYLRRGRGTMLAHSLIVLKTLLTFRSMTFAKALSGCVSNFSPHVAPAFAKSIST